MIAGLVVLLIVLLIGTSFLSIKYIKAQREARRHDQAQALLLAATTDSYGVTVFSEGGKASPADLEARIPKLRQALELDPDLTEAHYWLGEYGFNLIRPATFSEASVDACLQELRTYIQRTPNDGKSYSLALSSVWESRSPGALREKAWNTLVGSSGIHCPKKFTPYGKPVNADSWNEESNRLFEVWRDHYVELVTAYLSETPRKHLTDHRHHIPAAFMRPPMDHAPAKLIEWYRFIDRIYGADHQQFNVPCPYEDCAKALDMMGETNLARQVRESPERTHCIPKKTQADISPKSAASPKQGDGKSPASPSTVPPPNDDDDWKPRISGIPLPATCWGRVDDIPAAFGPVQLHARMGGTRYLVCGDQSVIVELGYRDEKARRLFRQDVATGKAEEIVLDSKGLPAFITSVIPQGDYVWFSTLDGIVRYDPAARNLKWVEKQGGFPGVITAGLAVGKDLWFAGLSRDDHLFVAKVDSETFSVRLFPPGTLVSGVTGLSWVGEQLLIRMRWYTFVMDPATGASRNLSFKAISPVIECAGASWVITPRGLEKVVDPKKLTLQLIARFSLEKSRPQFDYILPEPPVRLRHLSAGEFIGLTGDGVRLWLTIGNHLLAFEPGRNVWTGPFVMTKKGAGAPLFMEDDMLWSVVNWDTRNLGSIVLVKTGLLLAEAQEKPN